MKEDNTFICNKIRIGENAADNDKLISESKQSDLWFHLENVSSCHVVLSTSKEYPATKQMINHCAYLTKSNTKYKNLLKIAVNYTKIKNVRKTDILGMVKIKGKTMTVLI